MNKRRKACVGVGNAYRARVLVAFFTGFVAIVFVGLTLALALGFGFGGMWVFSKLGWNLYLGGFTGIIVFCGFVISITTFFTSN